MKNAFITPTHLYGIHHDFRLQSLKITGRHLDQLRQRVQFFLGIFVVVALATEPHAHPGGYIFDAGLPDEAIEFRVDTDVGCAHGLCGELFDFFDGPGCPAFELNLVYAFGQLNGVVAGDEIGFGGSFCHGCVVSNEYKIDCL